jgi:hypothetical protein
MRYVLRRPRAFWISGCNLVGLVCSMIGVVLLFWYALPEAPPGGPAALGTGQGGGPAWDAQVQRYHTLAYIGLALVLIGTLLEAVPPVCTAMGTWRRRAVAGPAQTPSTPPAVDRGHGGERRRFILDIAAVVVAAAAALFLWRQQLTMQGQLDEMQAEQRAWVYAEIFIGKRIGESGEHYYIQITLYYHNTGHLPAFFVFPRMAAKVVELPFDLSNVQNEICDDYRKTPLKDTDVGETLFPGEEHRGNNTNVEFNKLEWVNTVKANRPRGILIVGCIDYRYPGGAITHHQTRFAFVRHQRL